MSKDLLSEATRALRETEEASEFEARRARASVLAGLHQTRIRRRTRLVFLLPVAASFIAVGAWAATDDHAQQIVSAVQHWLSPPVPVNVHVNVNDLPSASAASLAPAPPPPATEPAPVAIPDPPIPPAPAPIPAASSAARPIANDPTLTLYRSAHTAHFVDHDPVRALAGWDAYLAAAPNGPFAPEARYNRALSLVRLGRNDEARSALQPFANGVYGSYRKAEASALLERLGE